MQKNQRNWMIVGIILIFSLVGTSAASARTEGYQEELTFSAVGLENLDAPQMALESDFAFLGSLYARISCYKASSCYKWTGRWFITYLRKSEGHWVTWCQLYVPDFIDNELDAKNWRWSDEYIAEICSQPDEDQTWEGIYLNMRKEMIPVECELICPIYS